MSKNDEPYATEVEQLREMLSSIQGGIDALRGRLTDKAIVALIQLSAPAYPDHGGYHAGRKQRVTATQIKAVLKGIELVNDTCFKEEFKLR